MTLKSFQIITFGCRVNQAESRMMGESLVKLGLAQKCAMAKKCVKSKLGGVADLVIINTCCVTKKAEREVRKEIRKVKKENPNCFLVVAGCWVNKIKNQNSKIKIKNDLKTKIDLLITNEQKSKIASFLKKKISLNKKQSTYKDKYFKFKKALIKIQEGCNNFCSYCIVPYVRGRSRSRPAEEIIGEIKQKVEEGIEEVVLTGIDIKDYKFKIQNSKLKIKIKNLELNKFKNDLVKLIRLILAKTKIKKISFGSISLGVFDKEFLSLYKQKEIKNRLTCHFHIPLQSGSDKVLNLMRRGYSKIKFLNTIKKINQVIPQFIFSTDIIVGFPGETKKEFKETIKTLKKIKKILGQRFTHIHCFRYSSREGTLAFKMEEKWGRVEEKEKKRRAREILKLCEGKKWGYNNKTTRLDLC